MTEEEIARHLAQAHAAGELQATAGYGRPLPEDEGWQQTPPALRMAFKILKDAGAAPPEIEMFRRRAALREALEAEADPAERVRLQLALSELEQSMSLRLESLRRHGAL